MIKQGNFPNGKVTFSLNSGSYLLSIGKTMNSNQFVPLEGSRF